MTAIPRHASRLFLRCNAARTSFFSSRHYLKTTSDDPSQLTRDDVGKLYHIPLEATKALNFDTILPSKLKKQVDTFEECALLCRQEFLEVVHCFQAARTSFPAIRVVLWGRFGTGKTTTLAQAVHYAYTQNWTIINVRDCRYFI